MTSKFIGDMEEYAAGQVVTILRELVDGKEYDNPATVNGEEPGDRMFSVRAADGWTGDVWESELKLPPYPQHCQHPEKCAGRSQCPRDPTCID